MTTKYRAVRTNGYASKAEAAYAAHLQIMLQAGIVRSVLEQPRVPLVAGIVYVPDFLVEERDGPCYYDVKGVETPVFKLKARLWKAFGPGRLRIVKRRGKGFITTKEIPGGSSGA